MSVALPAVSILVPYYNPGEFLREAVESVFAQTLEDWELLLISDGSTDGTEGIAQGYSERDPRVRALTHPDRRNHGVSRTRNVGLQQARGEWVALLDADDFWLPQKLEQQVALAREHTQAAMIFGRSQYWHSWSPADPEQDSIPELAPGDRLYGPPELWKICYPFGGFGAPCPSDLLIRRTAFEAVGGFDESFDGLLPTHEDIALLSKIFLKYPVYVSNACWDRYRRHENSAWSRAQRDGGEDRSRAFYFDWMREFLRVQGIRDREIWRRLDRRSWRYRHPVAHGMLRAAFGPVKRLLGR